MRASNYQSARAFQQDSRVCSPSLPRSLLAGSTRACQSCRTLPITRRPGPSSIVNNSIFLFDSCTSMLDKRDAMLHPVFQAWHLAGDGLFCLPAHQIERTREACPMRLQPLVCPRNHSN